MHSVIIFDWLVRAKLPADLFTRLQALRASSIALITLCKATRVIVMAGVIGRRITRIRARGTSTEEHRTE